MLNVCVIPDLVLGEMDRLTIRLGVQTLSVQEIEENEVLEKLEKQETVEGSSIESNLENGDTEKDWSDTGSDPSSQQLKIISLDEVAWHDTATDCWIVIFDYVYDCTEFLSKHPGGEDILLEYAGRDATLAFVGTGHSAFARQTLERYLIGKLPVKERIFNVAGGVQLVGV